MQAGLYIAFTGARAAEKKIEQIANNLANASSVGYKQDLSAEAGVLPLAIAAGPDRVSITGESPGAKLLYSTPSVQYPDLSPGPVKATGNPFDLSIDGDGYFTVMTKSGPRLTRAGSFRVDVDGDLATASGEKLLGGGGPIRVSAGTLSVGEDGQVMVDGAAVDTLRIQKAADPKSLRKVGRNLFEVPAGAAVQPAGSEVRIHQGSLEESNVAAVAGMTEMVEASRMFEAYAKMVSTISELNSKANELGRV
ncbi:MAG: flagellar hook-basal body protein [Deltaproteobacteria bacterium]|nr:flagellar hook-basal body protein [Deltaproteobacteria bacterium]